MCGQIERILGTQTPIIIIDNSIDVSIYIYPPHVDVVVEYKERHALPHELGKKRI